MAHVPIEAGRLERMWRVGPAAEAEPRLADPEEVEVVDQRGRVQQHPPACEVQGAKRRRADLVRHRPDHAADRLPEGEDNDQSEDRQEHVGRTFGRFGNELLPGPLEGGPGHARVLDSEKRQQAQVNGEGQADRTGVSRVDRLRRDREVADEGDGV